MSGMSGIKKHDLFYFLFIIITNAVGFGLISRCIITRGTLFSTIVPCMYISIVCIGVQFVAFICAGKSRSNYFGPFLISFVIFHFGCFLVYALGYRGDYFYLQKYEPKTVLSTLQYQFLCTGALFLAATFSERIKPFRFRRINRLDRKSIYSFSVACLVLVGLITIPVSFYKLYVFVIGNYKAVISLNERLPSALTLVTYFFVPFCVLAYIYSSNRTADRTLYWVLTLYSFLMTMMGDRTIGLSGIIIAIIIDVKYKNKGMKFRKYLTVIVAVIIISFLVVFVRDVREGGSFTRRGLLTVFAENLAEMGASFFPLVLIMRVCPSIHPFLKGKSYFYSVISGFVPASVDFTGIVRRWNQMAVEPLKWIEQDYDYNFGTGLSLCAEAYANFNWFGVVAIFLIGLVLIKLLKEQENNPFSWYAATILLYEFFTLPRRNAYYIFNHSFYCIIVVCILVSLFVRSRKDNEINCD